MNLEIMMFELPATVTGRLLRVGGYTLAGGAILVLMMGLLTYKHAGNQGLLAMVIALSISWISNLAGAVPVCVSLGNRNPAQAKNLLGGMLIRLIVLVVLATPILLSNMLPLTPFLLWLVGGYMVMLMIETTWIAFWIKQIGNT